MKRVLVTGAGGPAGVNFINSLRASDETMYIVASDSNRYHLEWLKADKIYLAPPNEDRYYLEFLNSLIEIEKIQFLHPQPDTEVKVISDLRNKISVKTLLPAKNTIDICQDKFLSAKTWQEKGIFTQHALLIKNDNDLKTASEMFGYPYWLRATQGAGGRGSTLVENEATASHWISYWRSRKMSWIFVAQEYLPGKNYAFQSLWCKGKLVVSQARERLEYIYPYLAPSGITGTPVVARTIANETVNKVAYQCIKAIDDNATGIFCVDLKENKEGYPLPTEINAGRFFTTSYFFTNAGINMPYYYLKLAFNEKLPPLKNFNALEEEIYWIRHIDCPAVMKRKEDLVFISI